MFQPKKYERTLEVELNNEELREKGKELSTVIIERIRVKGKAKQAAEGFAAELKLFDQSIESLGILLNKGREFRPVLCRDQVSVNGIEVDTVRLDTGEVVATRAQTEKERQADLFTPEVIAEAAASAGLIETTVSVANARGFLQTSHVTPEKLSLAEPGQGTPIEAALLPSEIDALVKLEQSKNVRFGSPRIKRAYVNGAPFLVTGHDESESKKATCVQAWPIRPVQRADAEQQFTAAPNDDGSYAGVRLNCGSKAKPDYWYVCGEKILFRLWQSGEIAAKLDKERHVDL